MGTASIANSLAFVPNLEKGMLAAKTVMNLINRIPKVTDKSGAIDQKEVNICLCDVKICFTNY